MGIVISPIVEIELIALTAIVAIAWVVYLIKKANGDIE